MFLETKNNQDNPVLIPLGRIKYITLYELAKRIYIYSDENKWEECFSSKELAKTRFNEIKGFLNNL